MSKERRKVVRSVDCFGGTKGKVEVFPLNCAAVVGYMVSVPVVNVPMVLVVQPPSDAAKQPPQQQRNGKIRYAIRMTTLSNKIQGKSKTL